MAAIRRGYGNRTRRLAVLLTMVLALLTVMSVTQPGTVHSNGSLLANRGFEQPLGPTGIPGWTPYIGTEASLSSAIRFEGNFSLRLQDTWSDKGGGVYSGKIPALPGELFRAAAIGMTGEGRTETYFYSNGSPGTFYALDAWTGERLFSQQVQGTNIVWTMTIGGDRNVYFASSNNGRLYKYDPVARTLTDLGINPSGKFVWSLQPSPDGSFLYGATYPGGKVFEYAVGTGVIRDLGSARFAGPVEVYAVTEKGLHGCDRRIMQAFCYPS